MSDNGPRSPRPAWVGWLGILVVITALGGAGSIMVAGVRSKEDCSAHVGSVEIGSGLYRPCELIGYQEGIVLVSLIALSVMVLADSKRTRAVAGFATMLIILVIAHLGLRSLMV